MPAYRVPAHVWRTTDGRLVKSGHPDAAVLAYAAGDEMSEDEAKRRGIVDALAGGEAADRSPKPAAKPGLTVNRRTDKKE